MLKCYFQQIKEGAEFYSFLSNKKEEVKIKALKIQACVSRAGFDGHTINTVALENCNGVSKGDIMSTGWNEYCEVESADDLECSD